MSIKALPIRLFSSSYITTVMEQSFQRTNEFRHRLGKIFGQGGYSSANYKVLNLCLGLLNVVLLIAAVALGANCAKIKKVYHSEAENYTTVKEQIHDLKLINDGYQKQLKALRAENTNLQANMSALDSNCSRCPSGWIHFNSSCYYFSPSIYETKTWTSSRADCIGRGSDLVVIDNPQEQMFVSHTIENDIDVWNNGFWIGFTDEKVEGTWKWINNVTEVEPRYWMDKEPNNSGEGEDCGVAVYSADNPWKTRYDASCQAIPAGLVPYNNLKDAHLTLEHAEHIGKAMDELQKPQKSAVKPTMGSHKQLDSDAQDQQEAIWELEHQTKTSKAYQVQIEEITKTNEYMKSHLPKIAGGCERCPSEWILMNSACYFFPFSDAAGMKKWNKAREFCQIYGGDLLVIDSKDKQKTIVNILENHIAAEDVISFWFGLSDSQVEGTWKWLDGTVLVEGFWSDGEPNDYIDEDCATVFNRKNFFKAWNDASCDTKLKWICEKTLTSES